MNNNLIETLKARFFANQHWYPTTTWEEVAKVLSEDVLRSLQYMEDTKGEVALVTVAEDAFIFMDTSKETPNRVNMCYDAEARIKRKKFPPNSSAMEDALLHNIELLTESEYYDLQEKFSFDLKTSSWILTPEKIRNLKGALFCDRRYDTVFTYHNGADSYYASRGYRAKLVVNK